jgi:hypothetical protein
VRAEALDRHTVELSWPAVSGAAGYDVWIREERSLGGRSAAPGLGRPVEPIATTCDDGTVTARLYMEPSVWAWEYAVKAYNGNDEAELSEWVTPPPARTAEELSLTEDDSIHLDIRHS